MLWEAQRENNFLLLQKVTYLFVIGALELEWFKNAKFRQ